MERFECQWFSVKKEKHLFFPKATANIRFFLKMDNIFCRITFFK